MAVGIGRIGGRGATRCRIDTHGKCSDNRVCLDPENPDGEDCAKHGQDGNRPAGGVNGAVRLGLSTMVSFQWVIAASPKFAL